MITQEQVKGRLERLEKQIAELEAEAYWERPWSDKRLRLDATIRRLEEERKMLLEMLK